MSVPAREATQTLEKQPERAIYKRTDFCSCHLGSAFLPVPVTNKGRGGGGGEVLQVLSCSSLIRCDFCGYRWTISKTALEHSAVNWLKGRMHNVNNVFGQGCFAGMI